MNLFRSLINRKNFLIMVIFWTVAVTTIRAIRLPNNYSQSHWLLDYRFGFMKRGLVGSVCSLFTSFFGVEMSRDIIIVLSGVMYGIFILGFLFVIFSLLKKYNYSSNIVTIVLLFSSSPFFVMSGHLFGYFDAILYVAAITSIWFIEKKQFLWTALISSLAILIHESYFLVGLPVVYFSIALKLIDKKAEDISKKDMAALLIPTVTFIFMTLYGIFFIDNKLLFKQILEHLRSYEFIYAGEKGLPHWLTVSYSELFTTQKNSVLERIFMYKNLSAFFPSLSAILVFTHASFKLKFLRIESLLLFITVFAPFAMYAVAFDIERISLNMIGMSFIALWSLKINRETFDINNFILPLGSLVMVLNVFFKVPLMGKLVDEFTSFERFLLYLPLIIFMLFEIYSKDKKFS